MPPTVPESIDHRFGDVEFQPARRRLFIRGQPVTVGARALDVLTVLVARRDRMVSKGELLDIVWPGLVVEENNVQVQISALRKLLGPGVIATNPGRGYQFIAALDKVQAPASPPGEAPDDIDRPPRLAPLARHHNLPEPDNELIGREADCELLANELLAARLVTIVGPAGIGKTRVALAVARQVVERFADGVWWVDLAALASADPLADAIATAAGHPLGPGDGVASLVRALRDCRMLIVLDNCEHLAGDIANLLRRVLEVSSGLQVLATSQVPLRLAPERCYRIDPLGMPADGAASQVTRRTPALALLFERARAADRRFELDDDQLPVAVSLCRQLDGLPLAIELAAARLPTLGLEALHGMLHQRFELLSSSRADAPHRQEALQAALDWSCTLLSPDELAALQRLSTFTASFRLADALDVIDGPTAPVSVGTLSSLVAKSLVQVNPREPGRFRLLESTRMHAAGGLRRCGHADAARDRWRKAMARLARDRQHDFWTLSDEAWIESFRDDQPDVVAALEDCAATGEIELAGDLAETAQLWDYLQNIAGAVRRRMKTAVSLLRTLEPAEFDDGRCAGLLDVLTYFGEFRAPPARPLHRALEHRVEAWRRRGNPWQLYRALGALAMHRSAERNHDEAARLLDEAARMASTAWPPRVLACGEYANAYVSMIGRDVQRYREHSEATLALYRKAGAVQDELRSKIIVEDARVLAGEHLQPAAVLESLAIESEVTGQAFVQVMSMTLLSFAHLLAGDMEAGRAVAERTLPLTQEHFFVDILLSAAALTDVRRGELERAARLLGSFSPYRPSGMLGWANEGRLFEQASAEIAAAMEPSRLRELLAEGTRLDREQRFALMHLSFAPPS